MMLELCDLSAGYDRHPAVHHISAQFPRGSLTAIVGPNGGGKSTLLKAIIGEVPLMTGHIVRSGLETHDVAWLSQQSEIDRDFPLRVADIIDFGHWRRTGIAGSITKTMRDATQNALLRVGMSAFAERPIASLSVGQFQRVLFARIIVQDARLILLDEPFAPIDTKTVADLAPILGQWRAEGRIILVVMHDYDMVRAFCPDALLLARDMVAHGPAADVLNPENLARAKALAESWQDQAPQCDRDLMPPHHHHHDHDGHA